VFVNRLVVAYRNHFRQAIPDFSGRFEVQILFAGVEASISKHIELLND
jgi:hypothetical protein